MDCTIYLCSLFSSAIRTSEINVYRLFFYAYPKTLVIYSDIGGNIVGTVNLLKQVDWNEIMNYANTGQIKWILNVSSAPC